MASRITRRHLRPTHGRRDQGFAMMALIVMIVLVSSYLLADVMTRTSSEVKLDNDQRTRKVMLEAKAALIAYATSQAWGNNGVSDQPGSLPCPSADDGGATATCSGTLAHVGRLPWKEIGTIDLRDGSGNILWYALSPAFRKHSTTIINSDTLGTLTLTGASPANAIVAVIIAPGSPVSGQLRSTSSAIDTYLEGLNTTASATGTFLTAQASETFNDQIMPITHAELMATVEPAVAARIQRDVKSYLTDYYALWGRYPFPVVFNPGPGDNSSRPQSSYIGSNSATEGLLPVASSPSYEWVTGGGAVSKVGTGTGSVTGTPSCVLSGNYWRCTLQATGPNCVSGCSASMTINVDGQVSNVGLSLAKYTTGTTTDDFMHAASNVTVTGTTSVSLASIGVSLLSSGNALVRYGATIQYTYTCAASLFGICFTQTPRTVVVTIRQDPQYIYTWGTTDDDPSVGWFIKNQWYRQTYYAVAPGYLPSGLGSCTQSTDCLTLSGLDSTAYPTSDDKHAVLLFMGRSLNGSARPSSSISNYMEGQNTSTGDNVFVHFPGQSAVLGGASTSVNDRGVVIAP